MEDSNESGVLQYLGTFAPLCMHCAAPGDLGSVFGTCDLVIRGTPNVEQIFHPFPNIRKDGNTPFWDLFRTPILDPFWVRSRVSSGTPLGMDYRIFAILNQPSVCSPDRAYYWALWDPFIPLWRG